LTAISFLSASRLWLLVVPVVLAVAYVVVQRRRRGYVVRFTNLDLLDEVAPQRPAWRRHLPALAVLTGVLAGVVAFARPAVADEVARDDTVVVLAMDVSLSMEATDVSPTRIDAAKEAARSFLDTVPDGVKVGVVAFDESARQVLAPTDRREAVERTIERLELGEGTAIGEAVFTSLQTIEDTFDAVTSGTGDGRAPATIVLLSDGETTAGRPDDEAAAAARSAGIAVSTIAFGTDAGTVTGPDGEEIPVPVNRQALAELAATTSGRSLQAESLEELREVYEDLGSSVRTEPVTREITEWFVLAAVVLVSLAAVGSMRWFGRLP
jgi:Ca-activated chloride channel family protein